jgi:hypothetical protein
MTEPRPDWLDDTDLQGEYLVLEQGHNYLRFEDNGHVEVFKGAKRVVFGIATGKKYGTKNTKVIAELKRLYPIQGKVIHIYRTGTTMSDTRYTEIREATADEVKLLKAKLLAAVKQKEDSTGW